MEYEELRERVADQLRRGLLSRQQRHELLDMLSLGSQIDELFPPRTPPAAPSARPAAASRGDALREHRLRWASRYDQLAAAAEEIVHASYLLFEIAGFEPVGSRKSWVGRVSKLVEGAQQDMKLLETGIRAGQRAREQDGLTLKGPESFASYILNERSQQVLAGRRRSIIVME